MDDCGGLAREDGRWPGSGRRRAGGVGGAHGRRQAAEHGSGEVRFVFYGRVATEDYQDPVTSRARQPDQAGTLVAGHGHIVAEFFDIGAEPGTLAWDPA